MTAVYSEEFENNSFLGNNYKVGSYAVTNSALLVFTALSIEKYHENINFAVTNTYSENFSEIPVLEVNSIA